MKTENCNVESANGHLPIGRNQKQAFGGPKQEKQLGLSVCGINGESTSMGRYSICSEEQSFFGRKVQLSVCGIVD